MKRFAAQHLISRRSGTASAGQSALGLSMLPAMPHMQSELRVVLMPQPVLLQARVVPEEQYIMKMTWIEGKDEWSPYCINHMDAIRAKYFPKAAPKVDKDGNEVARVLPNRKAINNLSEAAATNAPAPEGPIQVGTGLRTPAAAPLPRNSLS